MKKIIYLTLSLLICTTAYSQHILKDTDDVKWYQGIHQEYVYTHYNTSLLFTGEYLFYKLYCMNSVSKLLTKTSKVAYVELVGENGDVVFKHKILLEEGAGQGDFFIPTSVPSGNYKLLAYTKWMRNGTGNNFFQGDISIINPYRGDQSVFQNSTSQTKENNTQTIKRTSSKVALQLSSESIKNRSKGSVKISSIAGQGYGNYSISIRKLEDYNQAQQVNAVDYNATISNNKSKQRQVGDVIYMPEFKGEMISGKIFDKTTKKPIANKDVAVSVAENESVLDITTSNQNGVFYFHVSPGYNGNQAIFQTVDQAPANYDIVLDTHESIAQDNLDFHQFNISSSMEDMIVERSIHNQIQNGFFSVKPDTVKTFAPKPPFYGNPQNVYELDDYTRFPTVNETVIEIIEHAWTRKDDNGKRVFVVRGREFDPYFGSDLLPLVMVDGIFVQDHEKIIAYDARKIKSISVLRDEYYYGDIVYKGVLALKTIKGEFYKEFNDSYLKKEALFTPQPKKNYFVQKYNSNTIDQVDNRIPDYRHQLMWIPNVSLDQQSKIFEFFTSDVKGVYEISLEGFTNAGAPVSLKKTFVVD